MRATLIVKDVQTKRIVHLSQVESLDDETVNAAVRTLEKRFPSQWYQIDQSQIRLARQSLVAA